MVYERKIEQFLLDNMKNLLADHIHNIEIVRNEQQKNNPKAELDAVREKILRLKDIYLDGMIDKDVYERDYTKLKQKAAELSVEIERFLRFTRRHGKQSRQMISWKLITPYHGKTNGDFGTPSSPASRFPTLPKATGKEATSIFTFLFYDYFV